MFTTPQLWLVLLRRAIPIVGVGLWGWPGASIAIYFLLESWLFLTVRSAVEITFDPGYSPEARRRTGGAAARAFLRSLLITGIGMGVLILGFGRVVALVAFTGEASQRFLAAGWKETSFLAGLLALVVDTVVDGVSFKQRLTTRTEEQRAEDTRKVQGMLYRNTALLLGAMLIMAAAAAFDAGSLAVVVVISIVLAAFELSPRLAGHLAGAPTT